ncbi:MAG: transposase [Prosthecobacter sp.]
MVISELEREGKSTVGRRLIEVPGYTYRVFVTNREEDLVELWRDYNQRACIEQRIEELKNDLAADGFYTKQFYATEAAFWSVLFAFNLLSLYQKAIGTRSEKHDQRPATLRGRVFLGGAILGSRARKPVLYIRAKLGWY